MRLHPDRQVHNFGNGIDDQNNAQLNRVDRQGMVLADQTTLFKDWGGDSANTIRDLGVHVATELGDVALGYLAGAAVEKFGAFLLQKGWQIIKDKGGKILKLVTREGRTVTKAEMEAAAKEFKTWQDFLPDAQKRLDAAKANFGNIDAKMSRIPGNPFRGPNAPQQAYRHLEQFHGLNPNTASNRLHKIKGAAGLAPADDVVIGRTGDVYNAVTGERLGSLTDPTLGN